MEQVRQSAYSTLYGVTFEMSRLIMRLAEDMGEFFETEWYCMLPAARVGIDHFDSLRCWSRRISGPSTTFSRMRQKARS